MGDSRSCSCGRYGVNNRSAWRRRPVWGCADVARPRGTRSGVEAGREAGADRGPFGVEDREIDRVALVAPHVHVLAERALADRAQPLDRLLRADVASVGLERHAHAAERLETMSQEEKLR